MAASAAAGKSASGLDDGRAHGGGLLGGREAGGPALENPGAPRLTDGSELHDAGPEQHGGGDAHHLELHL